MRTMKASVQLKKKRNLLVVSVKGLSPRRTDWRKTASLSVTPTGRIWAREAEESPLLKFVTKKQLFKTLTHGKDSVFAAVICKV
jgi:hypothetical protein